jgi:hypothetical protein
MGESVGCLVLNAKVEPINSLGKARSTEKQLAGLVEIREGSANHPSEHRQSSTAGSTLEQHRHNTKAASSIDDGRSEERRSGFVVHPSEMGCQVQDGVRNESGDKSLSWGACMTTEDSACGHVSGDEHGAHTVP